MILSHRHKFIFIKGIKVAGTSAEIALSQITGKDDIVTPITPADERFRLGTAGEPRNYASHRYPWPLRRAVERRYVRAIRDHPDERLASVKIPRCRFINHMDLKTVLRLVPAARGYEVLCVDRSPYAKVMSLANWTEHHDAYRKSGEMPKEAPRLVEGVDRILADDSILRVLNVDRYRDLDGRVTARPWNIENLADDMQGFFHSRHLEPVPLVHAKEGAKSDSIDPATALRADQIAAINAIFAEEFELFGWPMLS